MTMMYICTVHCVVHHVRIRTHIIISLTHLTEAIGYQSEVLYGPVLMPVIHTHDARALADMIHFRLSSDSF